MLGYQAVEVNDVNSKYSSPEADNEKVLTMSMNKVLCNNGRLTLHGDQ